jgi:hypothetical protein
MNGWAENVWAEGAWGELVWDEPGSPPPTVNDVANPAAIDDVAGGAVDI